jgi:hypothetical protein
VVVNQHPNASGRADWTHTSNTSRKNEGTSTFIPLILARLNRYRKRITTLELLCNLPYRKLHALFHKANFPTNQIYQKGDRRGSELDSSNPVSQPPTVLEAEDPVVLQEPSDDADDADVLADALAPGAHPADPAHDAVHLHPSVGGLVDLGDHNLVV